MCTHTYAVNSTLRLPRTIDKSCPYSEIYHEFNNKISDINKRKLDDDLPLDKNGVCLFHSTDLEWKKKNRFITRFYDLLN